MSVLFEGLSVDIEMDSRATRYRTAYTASLKPFYTGPSDLRHPMEDEFAQVAWGADLKLGGLSTLHSTRYWTGGG